MEKTEVALENKIAHIPGLQIQFHFYQILTELGLYILSNLSYENLFPLPLPLNVYLLVI